MSRNNNTRESKPPCAGEKGREKGKKKRRKGNNRDLQFMIREKGLMISYLCQICHLHVVAGTQLASFPWQVGGPVRCGTSMCTSQGKWESTRETQPETRDLVSGPRCWSETPLTGDASGLAGDYPPV